MTLKIGLSDQSQAILMFVALLLPAVSAWLVIGAPTNKEGVIILISGLIAATLVFIKELQGGTPPATSTPAATDTTAPATATPAAINTDYKVKVATDAQIYAIGATVTVNGFLLHNGTPQANVLVSVLTYNQSMNLVYSNILTTDTNGVFTTKYSNPQQKTGLYALSVVAAINGQQIANDLVSYTVQ